MDRSAFDHRPAATQPSPASHSDEAQAPDLSKPRWLREAEERLRGHRSLLETLTEEDREFLRIHEVPAMLGPPPPPPMKRRPRRRGET
jgi:hypothetical protein